MSDRKLTLIELHFDEGFQVGPKTVAGPDAEPAEDGDETDVAVDEPERGDTPPTAVIGGLLALAVLVAVARRLLGGDDESLEIETPDADGELEDAESAD